MYPLMFISKYLLVFGCGIAGVLSLSRGFGLPIPFLEYGALEAWNMLLSAAFLAVSLSAAFFWHLPRRRSTDAGAESGAQDEWLSPTTNTSPPQRMH